MNYAIYSLLVDFLFWNLESQIQTFYCLHSRSFQCEGKFRVGAVLQSRACSNRGFTSGHSDCRIEKRTESRRMICFDWRA